MKAFDDLGWFHAALRVIGRFTLTGHLLVSTPCFHHVDALGRIQENLEEGISVAVSRRFPVLGSMRHWRGPLLQGEATMRRRWLGVWLSISVDLSPDFGHTEWTFGDFLQVIH